MMKQFKLRKRIILIPAVLSMLLVCGAFLLYPAANVRFEKNKFVESSRELRNPKRGFYRIYRFLIEDENEDYGQLVETLYEEDADTALSLVEINLQNYREGEITEAGLAGLEALFLSLNSIDKQLIVRFLYDWEGESEKHEPENVEIILTHMKQLTPVLELSDNIFIVQGLFTGNWGEMHGTKYSSTEDMRRLAEQLNETAAGPVYLSVRTPGQWRSITGLNAGNGDSVEGDRLAGRLGLFNDGMLGNESDYGTYEIYEAEEGESAGRNEELAFQEELCRLVPNGGEVIDDNPYNDFENAVKDLRTMHVTYLNEAYDEDVLKKWENTIVTEAGCFQGMDGLSYVERHLGYRLLITDADLEYERFGDHMMIRVTMRNAGFAPLYSEPEITLSLCNEKTGDVQIYHTEGNLRSLTGGNDADRLLDLEFDIDLTELSGGIYEIYFQLTDPDTGTPILLADEQEEQEYGYPAGIVEIQNGMQYIQMLWKERQG